MKNQAVSIGFGLERVGLAALERPRLFWTLFVLLLVLTGIGLSRISFDEKLRQVFRGDTEAYRTYVAATDDFSDPENDTLVLVESTAIKEPATFQALEDFGFELQLLDGVESVFSLFSLRERIDEEGRSTPLVQDAGEGLGEDLAQRIRAHPLLGEGALSADRSAMVYVVTPAEQKAPLAVHRALRRDIEAKAREILGDTGVTVSISGFPAIRMGIVDILVRDQKVLNAVGAAIGFLLSLIIFRSITAAIMTAAPSVVAGLSVVGVMGLIGLDITVMSSVVPVLVMIIGYTDAMHINAAWRRHRRAGLNAKDAERAAMSEIGQACILTALTTSLAFLSLTISDVELISEFGWIGAIGTIGGAIVILVVHALLMPLLGRFWNTEEKARVAPLDWLAKPSERLALVAVKRAYPVSAFATLALIGLAAMHFAVPPEHSVREHLSKSDPANAALGRIDTKLSGAFPISLIVPLDGLNPTGPEALARVRDVQMAVADVPKAGRPVSLWNLADWTGRGTEAGPELDELLEQLATTDRARFIGRNSGNAVVTVYAHEAPTREMRPLVDALEAAARKAGDDRVVATGATAITARESDRTIANLNFSLGFAVLAGLLLVALAFRDARIGAVAFIPNALPIVATGSLLYIAGLGMQFTSVIALTIAFGVAVDDTIHFVNGFRSQPAKTDLGDRLVATSRRIGAVLASTTLVIIFGLITTQTSGMPTVVLFGKLVTVTLATALVGDLFFLPAIMAGPARSWFNGRTKQ